jgi:hypothetical protein
MERDVVAKLEGPQEKRRVGVAHDGKVAQVGERQLRLLHSQLTDPDVSAEHLSSVPQVGQSWALQGSNAPTSGFGIVLVSDVPAVRRR